MTISGGTVPARVQCPHIQKRFAEVVVDIAALGVDRVFHYSVPPEIRDRIQVGSRVVVPFGPRRVQGFVVGFVPSPEVDEVRPIEKAPDRQPLIPRELVELAEWMASYYLSQRILALRAVIPAVILKRRHERVSLLVGPDEAGRLARVLHAQAPAQGRVLELLAEEGPLSKSVLAKRAGIKGISGVIERLEQKALVEETVSWRSPVKPRLLKAVSLTLDGTDSDEVISRLPAGAGVQADVIELLREKASPGPIPIIDLVGELGCSRGPVNALIEKGILKVFDIEVRRDPNHGDSYRDRPHVLTEGQRLVLDSISRSLVSGTQQSFVLHGVTGSGKTEVYLQAIAQALEIGRQAIVLVPEIALTPQMVAAFKGRFPNRVAVLHSHLGAGERYDEWRRIRNGEVQVAVGARSAVFAPFDNIGLIVIDEEHENTYKQGEAPRYHAREVALWRGRYHGAAVVLGSATPSMESYHMAQEGQYELLELPERIGGRPFADVTVVDMRKELKGGNRSIFSRELGSAIEEATQAKGQAILFLNRRGFSTFVLCRECGHVMRCPECDVSLTYHQGEQLLKCHYCDYTAETPKVCPQCRSRYIRYFGVGTQRVAEEAARHFPNLSIGRMDVDTMRRKGSHQRILDRFSSGELDILVGTQMVAKGLDVENVTVVGVISADTSLNLPDFRSAERTFQLLTQVAGRAGRGKRLGRVIVQTYSPNHYSIQAAAKQRLEEFYPQEAEVRRPLCYPPYGKLVKVTVAAQDQEMAESAAERLARLLADTPIMEQGLQLLGPVEAPLARLRGWFRIQLLLKVQDLETARQALNAAFSQLEPGDREPGLRYQVDVDPFNLL